LEARLGAPPRLRSTTASTSTIPPHFSPAAGGELLRRRTIPIALFLAMALAPAAGARTSITVGPGTVGKRIPGGFLGLSIEYRTVLGYAGTDPSATNPVFVQLMRNLVPGQRPVIRIGGDSTDVTWWPVPQMTKPPGVKIVLTDNWMHVAHAMAQALDARLILGINLEANSRQLASAEANEFLNVIGRRWVNAFEIGNEPELYSSYAWYRTSAGVPVPGRPAGWGFQDYVKEFSAIAGALPSVPIAGPATGSAHWLPLLDSFIDDEKRASLITVHAYPLKHCGGGKQYVPFSALLSDAASKGLASWMGPYVALAHSRGLPLRIDETNSITCGGQEGVSNSFASALWAADAMYQLARVGADGVNIHSSPSVPNVLFTFTQSGGRWQGAVNPDYYGLLLFARAAPAHSSILSVSGSSQPGLTTWATRGPDHHERIVMINKDITHWRNLAVSAPGTSGPGTLQVLRAPSVSSLSHVTLGGQSFGSSTRTGVLSGHRNWPVVQPHNGQYFVRLRPGSAALLTVARVG
jgi:hypothetical protein